MQDEIYQGVDADEMDLDKPQTSGLGLGAFSPDELRLATYLGIYEGHTKTTQLFVINPIEHPSFHQAVYAMQPQVDQQGDIVMAGMPVPAYHRCASPPSPNNVNLDHRTHDMRKNDLMTFISELHDGTGALLDLEALKERLGHIQYISQESFNQTWWLAKRFDDLEQKQLRTQNGTADDEKMDYEMDYEKEHNENPQDGIWGQRRRGRNRDRPQQNGPPRTGYQGNRPRQGWNGNGNGPPQTGYQRNRPRQGWIGNANGPQQRNGQQFQGQRNNNRDNWRGNN